MKKNPSKGGRIGMTASRERKLHNPKRKIQRLLTDAIYVAFLSGEMDLARDIRTLELKYFPVKPITTTT